MKFVFGFSNLSTCIHIQSDRPPLEAIFVRQTFLKLSLSIGQYLSENQPISIFQSITSIPFPPSLPYLSLINLNMHSEHIIHSLQSILKQRTNPHPLSNLYHPPIHPIHPITTPISSTNSTHKHDRLQNVQPPIVCNE